MGYEQVELKIVGKVSRHNSPRDRIGDKIWEEFVDYITREINEGSYSGLWKMIEIQVM